MATPKSCSNIFYLELRRISSLVSPQQVSFLFSWLERSVGYHSLGTANLGNSSPIALMSEFNAPFKRNSAAWFTTLATRSTGLTTLKEVFQTAVGVAEVGTNRSTFVVISLWGKFGGLCACRGTFSHFHPLLDFRTSLLFSGIMLQRKGFRRVS